MNRTMKGKVAVKYTTCESERKQELEINAMQNLFSKQIHTHSRDKQNWHQNKTKKFSVNVN